MTHRRQQHNNTVPTRIAQDATEAAQSLWDHSFAIVQLDDVTVAHLQKARDEARKSLFVADQVMTNKQNYQLIDQGHLVGFHEPSPAKYLYRALFHVDHKDGTRIHEHARQPWHSDKFQQATKEGGSDLHCMLLRVLERLVDLSREKTTGATVDTNNTQAGQKRKATSISSEKNAQEDVNDSSLPSWDACPMDFFYYHNSHKQQSPNCTLHTDRGALIVIALTKVPGLLVLNNDVCLHCPEQDHATILQSDNDNDNDNEYRLACVMAGEQLEQYISCRLKAEGSSFIQQSNVICLPPCVHWVTDHLKEPRLSISYELRLQQLLRQGPARDGHRNEIKLANGRQS